MSAESICLDGRITPAGEPDIKDLLTSHYIYQRVHASGGKALKLGDHLSIAERAFRHIHGFAPMFDEKAIASNIAALLRENRYPAGGSAAVMLCFFPPESNVEALIFCERPLIGHGYSVSSLRPSALSYGYDVSCEGFPTSFGLSVARLYDDCAFREGAARSVRCKGDALISCGDAPLFGINGLTLFTAPLSDGAADSVERRTVISAASKSRLNFTEEAIPRRSLTEFDELFFADAAGITSLSECDGAKFMSLLVGRLIKHF